MEQRPLIKQGWMRALIFLIVFILAILVSGKYIQPLLAGSGLFPPPAEDSPGTPNIGFIFAALTISSVLAVVVVLLFRKLVDRSTITSLGFRWQGFGAHAATGFFLGFLLIGIGTFIFLLSGHLEWTDLIAEATPLLLTLGMMVIIAVAEELVFRGYILNNLMLSMNKWVALVISAILFSLFHSNNPSISAISIVNLFLGGLLLGINYIYTKNLWFSIFFHFSWNYYQGSLLGYDVSGVTLPTLVQQHRTGSVWFTGGNFGFEGSAVSGVLCLLATLFLAWTYEKKIRLAGK